MRSDDGVEMTESPRWGNIDATVVAALLAAIRYDQGQVTCCHGRDAPTPYATLTP
ncbi:MAG: hypothetical protein ACXVHJ_14935 [Solirubrobacteraceae bacterium]